MFALLLLATAIPATAAPMDVTPAGLTLTKPRGLAVAGGLLWVCDSDANRLLALPILEDGRLGEPALVVPDVAQPFGVLVADGVLYVSEAARNVVTVRDSRTGEKMRELRVPAPRGLLLLEDGRLAVASNLDPPQGCVYLLQPGAPEEAPERIGEGALNGAWGLARGAGGSVFVGDSRNNRAIRMGLDGSVQAEIKLAGANLITALVRTPDALIATESTAHRVVVLDPDTGDVLHQIPTGAGTFPQGIAADEGGHVFVALTGTGKLAVAALDEGAPMPPATAVQPDEGPAVASHPRILAAAGLTVVAFGDSVTFGAHMEPGQTYPDCLRRLLDVRYGRGSVRVINAGIGGNTSSAGLSRFARDVLAHDPDFVLVNFGLNDSAKTAADTYKTDPERFETNLREIIRRCREAGAEPILSTITPVLDEYYFQRHPREFYEPDGGLQPLLNRYNGIVRTVAQDENVALAEWRRALEGGERELIRTPENSGTLDGVHPTPEGYEALALEFFLKLREQLER